MDKIKQNLIKQDKFGSNIVFSFNKNNKHNTLIGGIFSLLIKVFGIIVAFYFG